MVDRIQKQDVGNSRFGIPAASPSISAKRPLGEDLDGDGDGPRLVGLLRFLRAEGTRHIGDGLPVIVNGQTQFRPGPEAEFLQKAAQNQPQEGVAFGYQCFRLRLTVDQFQTGFLAGIEFAKSL
jgi:hypothetical protein